MKFADAWKEFWDRAFTPGSIDTVLRPHSDAALLRDLERLFLEKPSASVNSFTSAAVSCLGAVVSEDNYFILTVEPFPQMPNERRVKLNFGGAYWAKEGRGLAQTVAETVKKYEVQQPLVHYRMY